MLILTASLSMYKKCLEYLRVNLIEAPNAALTLIQRLLAYPKIKIQLRL